VHICNLSTQEAEVGGSQIQSQLGLCNEARAEDGAPVVEHLPTRFKALGSSPSTEGQWETHRRVGCDGLFCIPTGMGKEEEVRVQISNLSVIRCAWKMQCSS
jgi:hypothetical protein